MKNLVLGQSQLLINILIALHFNAEKPVTAVKI